MLEIGNLLKRINLTKDETRVALLVYNLIVEGIKRIPHGNRRAQPEGPQRAVVVRDTKEIEVHRRNLLRLIELMENYDSPCAEFMRNFPDWERARIANCTKLKEGAEYLQYDHTACNIANVTGNVVAAIGGITFISGLIFFPVAPIILGVGAIVGGVGGATSVSSNIADVARISIHMKEAKEICEKDKENYELLGREWRRSSEELERAMTDLIGFSVWEKMWENLKNFVGVRSRVAHRSTPFTMAIKACIGFVPPDHALFMTLAVDASASVLTTLIAMILFHRQTRSALHIYKLVLNIGRFTQSSVEMVAFLARAGSTAARTIAQRAIGGAFAGVGVALDITLIVLNSIELADSRMCKEGRTILAFSEALEHERQVLRDVYEAMQVR